MADGHRGRLSKNSEFIKKTHQAALEEFNLVFNIDQEKFNAGEQFNTGKIASSRFRLEILLSLGLLTRMAEKQGQKTGFLPTQNVEKMFVKEDLYDAIVDAVAQYNECHPDRDPLTFMDKEKFYDGVDKAFTAYYAYVDRELNEFFKARSSGI
jgi:hypothetical protein